MKPLAATLAIAASLLGGGCGSCGRFHDVPMNTDIEELEELVRLPLRPTRALWELVVGRASGIGASNPPDYSVKAVLTFNQDQLDDVVSLVRSQPPVPMPSFDYLMRDFPEASIEPFDSNLSDDAMCSYPLEFAGGELVFSAGASCMVPTRPQLLFWAMEIERE